MDLFNEENDYNPNNTGVGQIEEGLNQKEW